ncbi:N-acetylmuramoyl-L-alanine amidase family protein [Glycomyces tritici]|uniref:N-acetylmuramoyl-L-alanine amidase n=1 Tax=Glycomyces tritici TaxID=2665176 RepID=A0ABT7YMT9_9ACTN|nr:N-acetylmuramoyl-L-alanine amidase [Glycomyces tritici]MDN3239583.1 N-acetylmuramoyl-L-alanine amidase [Glycomyces tritici]
MGLASLPFAGSAAQAQDLSLNANRKIFLDPGHGGHDPGAVGNGLREKDLTLDIAKRTRAILDDHGYQTRMSRTSDVHVDLPDRAAAANAWGAHVFLSIHINAGGGTGFESHREVNATDHTRRFNSTVHRRTIAWMRQTASITDRGTKETNYVVLTHANMSAVLTENLFIDNEANANLLRSPNFRQDIAIGHFYGVDTFFN